MSKNNSSLGINNILQILSRQGIGVHFVGVGGVGMYSLFKLVRWFGLSASGSDRSEGEYLGAALREGEDIYIGTRSSLPRGTAMVVYSLAVAEDDGELLLAEAAGIPVVSRAEFLAAITACYQQRIGVSGSHGKSTVTAMLYKIFDSCRCRPTVLCGATLPLGRPYAFGNLDTLIYEACEYKDSFLYFSPHVSVFLNMELDHVDYFKDEDALAASFLAAMNRARRVIVNGDDTALMAVAKKTTAKVITVGRGEGSDYRYKAKPGSCLAFELFHNDILIGEATLSVIGSFNIQNAAMAAATAIECGLPGREVLFALQGFVGVGRRLEEVGRFHGRRVFYDYAHHPTEIAASINAIKHYTGEGVTVIFTPHTYSRTKGLYGGFVSSLSLADKLYVADIVGVREAVDCEVCAEVLAKDSGGVICPPVDRLCDVLKNGEGSIVIMGAAGGDEILRAMGLR